MRMLKQEEENDDVEVTWEDQQRINTFSKLNARYRTLDEKIGALKLEKEGLDDLSMELELFDEDEPVLYRIGEAFVHMPHGQATRRLEKDLAAVSQDIEKLADSAENCDKEMKELKLALYAKFGSAINLDE